MKYYTPDSSVYVHSHLHTEETFIRPRGFKQAQNLDKTSSTIKHGIWKKHLLDHVDLNKLRIWTKPLQQLNMAYAIPPPAKIEMDGDLQENWALFKLTWENYVAATDIGKKSSKHTGRHTSFGNRQGMSANIQKPANVSRGTSWHTKIFGKLTYYFEPKLYIIYQRYMFNSCTQEQSEKFDAYLIKLRHLIKTCEYGALEDELLRDQMVTGTSNNNVQARLLSESGLTLDRVIDICRSTEQAEQQLGKLNNSAETIHYTKADKKKRHKNS